jgi:predicted Zn-dependent peptidase
VINKTVLANGIKIVSKKMPHVRSISMGVWVSVGARDESIEQSGLSHFIEHMIFKGTARRDAYQIAKEFDAIGGQTNAFTSMEHTCYHAKVLDNHLETMVDILSDIFLNSVFDANEVERERPVIFQEIGMLEDTPEDYVHQLAGSNFWGDHPLGRSILGTRDNILRFKADTIKHYFQQFYHPERIVISAAGNLEHERILELIGPSFETIQNSGSLPDRTKPQIRPSVKVHRRELEQAHICLSTMGTAISDPRRFAFSLMNTLLGGNMSSRLFQEIREKRGLAYSVYSFISSHVDSGMFGVYCGVDPKNTRQAIKLIHQALQTICQKKIARDELFDAKEYTKGNLFLASESADNQMVRLAQNEIYFGKYIPLRTVIDKVEAVNVDDIQELARSLFKPQHAALTLLGPVDASEDYEFQINC